MLKKSLYLLTIVLSCVLAYVVFEYFAFVREQDRIAAAKGLQTTVALRDQVSEILTRIVAEGNRLAADFGKHDYSPDEIKQLIKNSALRVPEIQGVTAAFEPFALSADIRLFSPYYNKGTQEFLQVETSYDYSIAGRPEADWYTQIRDGGAKWIEPYFAKGAQDWYVDYGIPFYYGSGDKKGEVRGTITMSFVCSEFKNLIHSLSLGKTGDGFITSGEGTFLAHPTYEFVGRKRLSEWKSESRNPRLTNAYNELLAGKTGQAKYKEIESGRTALFFFEQIPVSSWGLGLTFFKEDLTASQTGLHRRYIRMALLLSAVIVCLLANYFNRDYLDAGEIWRLSLAASVLLLANTFLVGYLQHVTDRRPQDDDRLAVYDLDTLDSFVQQHQERVQASNAPPSVPIPTGLFIRRLDFEDSYNVNTSGTIWQKYPLDVSGDVDIGFRLPQMSPFAEASYVEESYRKKIVAKEGEQGYLLVGWDFRVTLRLNLQYADFPFDKRRIDIQIVPKNLSDRLLFVPDLASYDYTNPSQKCGLSDGIEMSGSEIVESYFDFTSENYAADFGYGTKAMFEEVTVLHFNIRLRRILLNAFITYLIPIAVALIMMFILIYACRKTMERQGIIESMAAFIFVLTFSHIDLRREIVTGELIYLEYFYFITYAMVILSTFNLVTYTLGKNRIFDFNDNQVFKALYFPLFFFAVLTVTLTRFY